MVWNECWGTYAATGPYNNVVMGGSPANSMYGLDLLPAKGAGYGNGIEFRYSQDINQLYVHINLIGYGSDPNNNYIANQEYVHGNFTYDWYVDIWYSTDNQATWTKTITELCARHNSDQTLAYKGNWGLSHVNWSANVNLPADFTHVKVEVRGEDPALRHQNIYTREVVIQSFKPWAIRKNNQFKSLDVLSGFFKIRKSNSWTDKSEMLLSDVNRENVGTARIRKNGTWRGQNKIGN